MLGPATAGRRRRALGAPPRAISLLFDDLPVPADTANLRGRVPTWSMHCRRCCHWSAWRGEGEPRTRTATTGSASRSLCQRIMTAATELGTRSWRLTPLHGRLPGTRLTRSGSPVADPYDPERVSGDRVAIGDSAGLCRTVLTGGRAPSPRGVGDRCAGPQSVWRSGRRRKRLYGIVEGGDLAAVEERSVDADGGLVPLPVGAAGRITALKRMAGADHNRGCITGQLTAASTTRNTSAIGVG